MKIKLYILLSLIFSLSNSAAIDAYDIVYLRYYISKDGYPDYHHAIFRGYKADDTSENLPLKVNKVAEGGLNHLNYIALGFIDPATSTNKVGINYTAIAYPKFNVSGGSVNLKTSTWRLTFQNQILGDMYQSDGKYKNILNYLIPLFNFGNSGTEVRSFNYHKNAIKMVIWADTRDGLMKCNETPTYDFTIEIPFKYKFFNCEKAARAFFTSFSDSNIVANSKSLYINGSFINPTNFSIDVNGSATNISFEVIFNSPEIVPICSP